MNVAPTRRAAALSLLALAFSLPAGAGYWYEHYEEAERALANGQWRQAVGELNEAIARKGDSGARQRTYGMRVVDYFPYLRLGIAYYELGELEAALTAFETEDRLGAVQGSETASDDLQRYRESARAAQKVRAAEAQRQVDALVETSISEADRLEREGRLTEAIEAIDRGLAAAPDHTDLLDRLRRIRERRQRLDDAEQVDLLSREARSLLAEGRPGEAVRRLRQALELAPGEGLRSLLEQAQKNLAEQLSTATEQVDREHRIVADLSQAGELEDAGRFAEALTLIEGVLALQPSHPTGLAAQQRLIAADRRQRRDARIEEALHQAESELASSRFEGALAAAHDVLALAPDHPQAVSLVAEAYRALGDRLLGRTISNLPPAVRFADYRQASGEGTRVEVLRSPRLRWSGVAIDAQPVELLFTRDGGAPLPAVVHSQQEGAVFVTEFAIDVRVEPGPAILRLVATDTGGLSSTIEYQVFYDRPLVRSPAFLIAVASIPLLGLGALGAHRLRRRRQLLRRRFNPFVAGAPVVDGDLFVGREPLVEQILQTIHNNSLLLFGERRIGKTSLQLHLRKRLRQLDDPQFEFHPVYVDLQGIAQERLFATLGREIFEQLAPDLIGLDSAEAVDLPADYGYYSLVRDLRRVLGHLRGKSDKQIRLVLLIDEVDELNDYDPRINQRLRSLFMKGFSDELVAVVSGVQIKLQWDKEGSPWYNFFEQLEVRSIARRDALRLVERPLRGAFRLEPGLAEGIVDRAECRPYQIQRISAALVQRAHAERRRTLRVADLEALAL